MAAGPQRAANPAAHVSAHVAPVERALLERARVLSEGADAAESAIRADPGALANVSDSDLDAADTAIGTARFLAQEFRTLAAELHHW